MHQNELDVQSLSTYILKEHCLVFDGKVENNALCFIERTNGKFSEFFTNNENFDEFSKFRSFDKIDLEILSDDTYNVLKKNNSITTFIYSSKKLDYVLVDNSIQKIDYNLPDSIFLKRNSCQVNSDACTGAVIAGTIAGGLSGAGTGASTGGAIAGPHGAAIGAAIGGTLGAIGGALGAAAAACTKPRGCDETPLPESAR